MEDTSQQVNYYYDSNPFDGGTYTSGALGRLAAIAYQPMTNGQSEPAFQEWYAYLSPGAVTKKRLVSTLGSSTLNLDGSWTYDNEGKMTSVTYPTVSNHSAKYTYGFDASARPSTMQDINSVTQVSGLSYGPSNELLGITYYGLGETRTYNSRLQLTAITSPWFSTQYAYPATANIGKVSAETNFVTGEQVAYQYDSLQRLINAQTTAYSDSQYPNLAWGQGFVYDGFGNLSQKTALKGSVPTLSVTVDQTTNRVAGTYDQDGNLTSPGGATFYGYDIENRMVAVNNSTFYAYDPQNRRVLKQTSSGAQEVYFYGIDGKKLGTYLPTFTGTPYFYASDISVYFGNRRVSHGALQGSTLVFTNTLLDRLNSVRNAGTSGSASSFYPYGEDKGTAAPNDQTKFATYTRDLASGLDYAMNRYYSNTWGRFTTPDPYSGSARTGIPQSWNRYGYMLGDPMSGNDGSGLDPYDCYGDDGNNGGIFDLCSQIAGIEFSVDVVGTVDAGEDGQEPEEQCTWVNGQCVFSVTKNGNNGNSGTGTPPPNEDPPLEDPPVEDPGPDPPGPGPGPTENCVTGAIALGAVVGAGVGGGVLGGLGGVAGGVGGTLLGLGGTIVFSVGGFEVGSTGGTLIGGSLGGSLGGLLGSIFCAEHTTNPTPSHRPKHEKGQGRRGKSRGPSTHPKFPPRKPPEGWRGPWPPKPGTPWH